MQDSEQRLFDARLAATASDCEASLPAQIADVVPDPAASPCGTPQPLDENTFITPPGDPRAPTLPRLLPDGIVVSSRARVGTCAGGSSVRLGFVPVDLPEGYQYDELTSEVQADAGVETALVYLDDTLTESLTAAFKTSELYRLAGRISAISAYVQSGLGSATDEDHAEFSDGLASVMIVDASLAELVTLQLLSARTTLETIVDAQILNLLDCGYNSAEFWAKCDSVSGEPIQLTTDPEDESYVHAPYGFAFSSISQGDADDYAWRSVASQLACVVGNDTQTAYCQEQVLDAAWGTAGLLSNLNGQTFYTLGAKKHGEAAIPRTLAFSSTVAANTYYATTKELANSKAAAAAALGLDCFVPSPATKLHCAIESVNASAAARAELVTVNGALNEMATGDKAKSRATKKPDNKGFLNPSTHTINLNRALLVDLPTGLLTAPTAAAAKALASAHAASLLDCVWVSPEYKCECLGAADTPSIDYQFLTSELTGPENRNVRLNYAKSTWQSQLDEGQFVTTVFPGTVSNTTDLPWKSTLGTLCHATLECVFQACAITCCAPMPDDRPRMENEEVNRFLYFNDGDDSTILISNDTSRTTWLAGRTEPSGCSGMPVGCVDPSKPGCEPYTSGCEGDAESVFGTWESTAPTTGTPARFRYGGTLEPGMVWADPDEVDGYTIPSNKTCGTPENTQKGDTSKDHYSCVRSVAESIGTFANLYQTALSDATARLNCDHINWPRRLSRCRSESERPFRTINIPGRMVAATTRLANMQAEKLVLSLMQCAETPPFKLIATDNNILLANPSAINGGGGGGLACNPETADKGLRPLKLYQDCSTEWSTDTDGYYVLDRGDFHVFLEAKCCDNVVKWILHVVESADDYGAVAVGSGMSDDAKDEMALIQSTSNAVVYVGSYAEKTSPDSEKAAVKVKQFLSAPISMGGGEGGTSCNAFFRYVIDGTKHKLAGGSVSGTLGSPVVKTDIELWNTATDGTLPDESYAWLKISGTGNLVDGWLRNGFTVSTAVFEKSSTPTKTNTLPTDEAADGVYYLLLGYWIDKVFTPLACGNIGVGYCGGFTITRG